MPVDAGDHLQTPFTIFSDGASGENEIQDIIEVID